jgi:hypothetical protein
MSFLRTIRKPFALPLTISPPHRVAGIRSHWGATTRTHFPGPGVDSQSRRIFVLCFDGTGDQFDADVRLLYPFVMLFLTVAQIEHEYRAVLLGTQEGRCEPADGVLSGSFVVVLFNLRL